MKIEDTRNTEQMVTFKSLADGDAFQYGNHFFFKLCSQCKYNYNAVDLTTNHLWLLYEDTRVMYVKAKIVIENLKP